MAMERISYPPLPNEASQETDWHYSQRRDMQEIICGLYLGPYAAAKELELLKENNITHIVCIRQDSEAHFVKPKFEQYFRYMVLDIADQSQENIITRLPIVRDFIDDCFGQQGSVLIHSNTGISRSAAFVIGYLMEKYGQTYSEALNHVQRKRFCVSPNEGFAQQLREYEAIYQAQHVLLNGQTSQDRPLLKRKFEEDLNSNEEMEVDRVTSQIRKT